MAHYAPNSLDDELRYLSDVQTREDELRRLNEELVCCLDEPDQNYVPTQLI